MIKSSAAQTVVDDLGPQAAETPNPWSADLLAPAPGQALSVRGLVAILVTTASLYLNNNDAQADPQTVSAGFRWTPWAELPPQSQQPWPHGFAIFYGPTPWEMDRVFHVGYAYSATVPNLVPGESYYFHCKSYIKDPSLPNDPDRRIYSDPSQMVFLTIPPREPGAPLLSNFTVVPGSVELNHRGKGQVAVRIQVTPGTYPLEFFKFYRNSDESGQAKVSTFIHNNPADREILLGDFIPGETYQLRIAAVYLQDGKLVEGRSVPTTLTVTVPATPGGILKPNPLAGREPVGDEWEPVADPTLWVEYTPEQPTVEIRRPNFESFSYSAGMAQAALTAEPNSLLQVLGVGGNIVFQGLVPHSGRIHAAWPSTNDSATFSAVSSHPDLPAYDFGED